MTITSALGAVTFPLDTTARLLAKSIGGFSIVGEERAQAAIIYLIRFPRVLAAALVGAALARQRQASRAVFFHDMRENGTVKGSWGLRLWNGFGEQMLTVFFPNPYLTDEQKVCKEPDWNRLALWERLREAYSSVR